MILKRGIINIKDLFTFILTYIMIIMHGAVIWSAVIGDGYIPLIAVVIIALFAIIYFGLPFRKTYLLYCVTTAACYFISAIMNGIGLSAGLNIKTAIIIDINILIASAAVNLNHRKAATMFVKIISLFAGISLICFFAQQIIGIGIFSSSLFPYINWGRGHWGYLIYSYTEDPRNYGIFYEPGVYQVLLNSALYLLLFGNDKLLLKKKSNQKNLIIILLAIATARSTTGYISMIIILFGFLIKRYRAHIKLKKYEKGLILIVLFMICFIIFDYIRNGSNSLLSTYVIDKLSETNITTGDFNYDTSGGARLFIIDQAMEALKRNPLFGVGSVSLSNAIADEFWPGFGTGNSLFSTIATKGLVTLLITIGPIFYVAYRNRQSNIEFIVFLLVYINTAVAQSQLLYGSFVLLALYRTNYIEATNKVKITQFERGGVVVSYKPRLVFCSSECNKIKKGGYTFQLAVNLRGVLA